MADRWTKEEDARLEQLVAEMGTPIPWSKIGPLMPGRNARYCRLRWGRLTRKDKVFGPWTPEEDALLHELYHVHGRKWKDISNEMENRTAEQVYGRFTFLHPPGIAIKDIDHTAIQQIPSLAAAIDNVVQKKKKRKSNKADSNSEMSEGEFCDSDDDGDKPKAAVLRVPVFIRDKVAVQTEGRMWTEEEDNELFTHIATHGTKSWSLISALMSTDRGINHCKRRYQRVQDNMKKAEQNAALGITNTKRKAPETNTSTTSSKKSKSNTAVTHTHVVVGSDSEDEESADSDEEFRPTQQQQQEQQKQLTGKKYVKLTAAEKSARVAVRSEKRTWSYEEDALLVKLHAHYIANWQAISEQLDATLQAGRDKIQCRQRYAYMVQHGKVVNGLHVAPNPNEPEPEPVFIDVYGEVNYNDGSSGDDLGLKEIAAASSLSSLTGAVFSAQPSATATTTTSVDSGSSKTQGTAPTPWVGSMFGGNDSDSEEE